MSGESQDEGEKSFEPTQRRLDEARKRGEVPQSTDFVTAASYGGFLLAALAFGTGSLLALGGALEALLAHAAPLSSRVFADSQQPLFASLMGNAAAALWPWLVLPAALALLSLIGQQTLVVAPQRISFKTSRISPFAQLRNKFGAEGLMAFFKGCLKVALYATATGLTLADATPRLIGLAAEPPRIVTAVMLGVLLDLLGQIVLIALALGLADLVWQRLSFQRQHMMTRKELTDEAKDSEGDPHLKQQRRQKGISIAMNQMLSAVPEASVVIVNPTHYAVALKWDRAKGGAPVCVAKGVDEMAARIRERAIEAGVPIRRDPPTARAIFASVDVGQEVARPEWRAVAAAIRFAERLRAQAGKPVP